MSLSQKDNLLNATFGQILSALSSVNGSVKPQHANSAYGSACTKLNVANNHKNRSVLHKFMGIENIEEAHISDVSIGKFINDLKGKTSNLTVFRSKNCQHKTSIWGVIAESWHKQNSKVIRKCLSDIWSILKTILEDESERPIEKRERQMLTRRNRIRKQNTEVNRAYSGNPQITKPSNSNVTTNKAHFNENVNNVLQRKFMKAINRFAITNCDVCLKLCYPDLMRNVKLGSVIRSLVTNLTGKHLSQDVYTTCSRCAASIMKGKVPSQSVWNKMSLSEIPPEIEQLSVVERRLVAQINPYMKVYLLCNRRGQNASRGMVIHFPNQVDEICKILPTDLKQADVLFIQENFSDANTKKITQIRPKHLYDALRWLQQNNPFYKDILIRDNVEYEDSERIKMHTIQSLPSVIEKDSISVPAGYETISESIQILRASFSQSHSIFGNSRGKQCTAIAATFLSYTFVDPPITWTRSVLDEIILSGDKLYNERHQSLEFDYLNVDDVCGVLHVHQAVPVRLTIPYSILQDMQGICYKNRCAQDLSVKIRQSLSSDYSYFMITVNEYTTAYCNSEDHVYYLDSHDRGPKGFVARSRGTGFVMKIPRLIAEDRISYMISRNCVNSKATETPFTFTPLKIDYEGPDHLDDQNASSLESPVASPLKKVMRGEEDIHSDESSGTDEDEKVEELVRQFDTRNTVDCAIMEENFVEPNVTEIVDCQNNTKNNPIHLERKKRPPVQDRERHLEVLAFPHIFPDGVNGLDEIRNINITPLDYFQQRLMCGDKRFHSNSEYLFYALSRIDKWRLKQSIAVISNLKTEGNLAIQEDVLQQIGIENPQIIMEKIRGSYAYWKKYGADVIAMIKTLGTPTFFFTFSYDDLNSYDSINALLKSKHGGKYEDADPKSPSYEERWQLLNDHPIAAARHFSMRVFKFLNYLKEDSFEIFGTQVMDHTYRIEFQARGSPHAHCLLWLDSVPEWNSPEGINFLDRNVSCSLDTEDKSLVLRYQTHKHSKTCYKGENYICRFGFPKLPIAETEIFDDDRILRNKGKFCAMKRSANEVMINNYHPKLLNLLKCNMDIQPVTSAMAVAYYIAKYISKSEPQELRESIRDAINRIKNSSAPIQQKMLRISYSLLNKRELSAQEAAYRICHLPVRHCSRAVKFISTYNKAKRLRLLDREALKNGEVKLCDNDIERYMNRPDSLESICLFEFVAHYALKRSNPKFEVRTSNEEDDLIEFEEDNLREDGLEDTELKLKNCKGTIKKRKRPYVINYFRFNPIDNREEYYYSMLLLYLPFRIENFCDDCTAVEAFKNRHMELRTSNHDPIINVQLAHEIETALVRLADFTSEDLECIELENPPSLDYEEVVSENQRQSSQIHPELHLNPLDTIRDMLKNVTPEQRSVFDTVRKSIEDNSFKDPLTSLKLFVTGCGGTGKSYVLKLLRIYIQHKLSQDSLVIAAPSGRAAYLVGGVTCHRAFSLPIEHEGVAQHQRLSGRKLAEFRRLYCNVEFFIIDEVSMLSYENLRAISQRLCEVFESEHPFAGKSIILMGDILQLPPVKGHFVFHQPEKFNAETHYWRMFAYAELKVNKRQCQDPLLGICNRLRIGELTSKDIELLKTRVLEPSNPNFRAMKEEFKDAFRLNPTLNKCDRHNEEKVEVLRVEGGVKLFNIKAFDTYADGSKFGHEVPEKIIPKKINKTAGIPKEINLCVGAKVMLKRNFNPDKGLCNGSFGEILEFSWPINSNVQINEGELPARIKVKFDHLETPEWIDCITAEFYARKQRISRRMVPFSLAWAFTYHKAQGMSISKCVIDLGSKLFAKGMAYVALSRVCSLNGLAIEANFKPELLLTTQTFTPANVHALDELERLQGKIIVPRR